MKSAYVFLLLFPLTLHAGSKSSADCVIVPGQTIGALPWEASQTQFIKLYGRNAVPAQVVGAPNQEPDDTVPGLQLFPNSRDKDAEISWDDAKHRAGVGGVILREGKSEDIKKSAGNGRSAASSASAQILKHLRN